MHKTRHPTPNDHATDAPKRDRHGERSVPPPLEFDIHALPDSTLITSRDVAAHGRWAVATVEKWRQQPDHPLKWLTLPGGHVRTTLANFKAFLASGKPRKRPGPKPRAAPTESPPSPHQLKPRKPSRRRAADAAAAAELRGQS
jgi:hypothetical protein